MLYKELPMGSFFFYGTFEYLENLESFIFDKGYTPSVKIANDKAAFLQIGYYHEVFMEERDVITEIPSLIIRRYLLKNISIKERECK